MINIIFTYLLATLPMIQLGDYHDGLLHVGFKNDVYVYTGRETHFMKQMRSYVHMKHIMCGV